MRYLKCFQKEINQEEIIRKNELFAFYIKKIIKEYIGSENYDVIDAQYDNFILPGKIELTIDGYNACIDLSSDVLAAIYQIVLIRNATLENRFKEEDYVDLREYF